MVSLWPWRGDDSSPASFEKALSALSTKITESQARLERTRATSRRVRVLWMLYLSVAYLIIAIVQLLVVGYQNMGPVDWAGVAGGPVVIYAVKTLLATLFNYRIESLSARLKDQQDERAKTIQKLKDATKYDSTLQLLEKYGGGEAKAGGKSKEAGASDDGQGQDGRDPGAQDPNRKGSTFGGRTNLPPPPTANIQRPESIGPSPVTPQPPHGARFPPSSPPLGPGLEPSAEFAPNAFAQPPPQAFAPQQGSESTHHWYDRILDVLLGEDETAPKNRIVLICRNCRLVNGQAPPGTKSLADMGIWKCMSCGASNGEIDEGKRIVKEVLDSSRGARPAWGKATSDDVPVGEEFKESDDDDSNQEISAEAVDVGQNQLENDGQSTGRQNASGSRKRRNKKN